MLDDENDQNEMNDENEVFDDGEGLDENNEENAAIDENDSNSDNRFPEVNEGGWIQWFVNLKGNEFNTSFIILSLKTPFCIGLCIISCTTLAIYFSSS